MMALHETAEIARALALLFNEVVDSLTTLAIFAVELIAWVLKCVRLDWKPTICLLVVISIEGRLLVIGDLLHRNFHAVVMNDQRVVGVFVVVIFVWQLNILALFKHHLGVWLVV